VFLFRINSEQKHLDVWLKDRTVSRPVPTHYNTIQDNADTYMRALSGIRTHDPIVRAVRNSVISFVVGEHAVGRAPA